MDTELFRLAEALPIFWATICAILCVFGIFSMIAMYYNAESNQELTAFTGIVGTILLLVSLFGFGTCAYHIVYIKTAPKRYMEVWYGSAEQVKQSEAN